MSCDRLWLGELAGTQVRGVTGGTQGGNWHLQRVGRSSPHFFPRVSENASPAQLYGFPVLYCLNVAWASHWRWNLVIFMRASFDPGRTRIKPVLSQGYKSPLLPSGQVLQLVEWQADIREVLLRQSRRITPAFHLHTPTPHFIHFLVWLWKAEG